jgi:hypothetical protein
MRMDYSYPNRLFDRQGNTLDEAEMGTNGAVHTLETVDGVRDLGSMANELVGLVQDLENLMVGKGIWKTFSTGSFGSDGWHTIALLLKELLRDVHIGCSN